MLVYPLFSFSISFLSLSFHSRKWSENPWVNDICNFLRLHASLSRSWSQSLRQVRKQWWDGGWETRDEEKHEANEVEAQWRRDDAAKERERVFSSDEITCNLRLEEASPSSSRPILYLHPLLLLLFSSFPWAVSCLSLSSSSQFPFSWFCVMLIPSPATTTTVMLLQLRTI